MAQYAYRLRRALSAAASSSLFITTTTRQLISQTPKLHSIITTSSTSTRSFTSTTTSLSSRSFANDNDEIGPDTILFEGCDYNHWLIVVNFPKDPKPSNQEMVQFYEGTAQKIFGSLEEAKKKIYACSTTTYTGFQVECSEETSEKFKDLPGVIFVLPDSYIDPVNKEYGGDKYINGQIIPRPPPIQYGRSGPNREFRSRPTNRGPMEGPNRNYGPPGTPQHNFSSPPPPQRNIEWGNRNYGQPGTPQENFNTPPPPQRNMEGPYRNYGPPGAPQQNIGPSPPQRSYGPPHPQQQHDPPSSFPPPQNYDYNSPPQQSYGQRLGEPRGPMPPYNAPGGLDNSQGERGNFNHQGQHNFGQGNQGNYGNENRVQENGPAYNQYNQRG